MRKIVRTALLATAGIALSVQSASAAGNPYSANGDVLLCFKAAGAANDVIFDVGSMSQFFQGSVSFDLAGLGYNPNFVTANVGAFSSVQFAVYVAVGTGVPRTVGVTDESPGGNVMNSASPAANALVASSINNMGSAYAAILGSGILTPGRPGAVRMATSTPNGYTSQGDNLNNTLNGLSSVTVADFGGLDALGIFETLTGSGNPVMQGTFDLNPTTGQLVYTAVPEPATYGCIAGLGLLALSLRRQFARC
jgi:hypothetical protein